MKKFKIMHSMIFLSGMLFAVSLLSSCQTHKQKQNKEISFIIVDLDSGQTIKTIGDYKTQESPCSTFKIALSLMGFDAGILKDENTPEWPYKDEYNAQLDIWKQAHTPKTWIQHSCIWYSQHLTPLLGINKFQNYVKSFDYGNQDVSGNPGKIDGLTKSWLCSSLKISPQEQIEFIKKVLHKTLPVSEYAHEKTQNILYVSDLANGWKLHAKTSGGIFEDGIKTIGWLVGWVTNENKHKTFVFAYLIKSNNGKTVVNGSLAKQEAIDILESVIGSPSYPFDFATLRSGRTA